MNKGSALRFACAIALLGLATGGCGIGKALGGGKNAPDEFAITTKAPLVVPPDYGLRPPRPGESRPQELSPSERAQQVLLGDASASELQSPHIYYMWHLLLHTVLWIK